MQTTDKQRLGVYLELSTDKELRVFAAQQGIRNLSELVESMIRHCLESRHFRAKYQTKEKAIDY